MKARRNNITLHTHHWAATYNLYCQAPRKLENCANWHHTGTRNSTNDQRKQQHTSLTFQTETGAVSLLPLHFSALHLAFQLHLHFSVNKLHPHSTTEREHFPPVTLNSWPMTSSTNLTQIRWTSSEMYRPKVICFLEKDTHRYTHTHTHTGQVYYVNH